MEGLKINTTYMAKKREISECILDFGWPSSYLINVRWIFYLSVYLAAKPKSEVPALCVGSEDEATGQVSSGQDFMKEQRTKDLDG